MSGRPNWYYDHPPSCNCAECTAKRIKRKSGLSPIQGIRKFFASLLGR